MLEIDKIPEPGFVRVIVFATPVVLMTRLPNARLAGARVILGRVPVPDRETFCGLPEALSAMEMLAAREPVAVGLNVTVIVQLAPVARVAGGGREKIALER